MIDQILFTLTDSGNQIVGRILGNPDSDKILICSHGFGVDSDSMGMFSLITEMYKNSYLTVRFHYVSKDDFTGDTYVHPFAIQKEKLKTVIEKITTKYPGKSITLLSHSQGCWVTPMYLKESEIEVDKLILLSPPTTPDIVSRIIKNFSGREGSKIDLEGMSTLKRSTGNKTYVPKEYWNEADGLDPLPLYKYVNKKYNTYFVLATKDTVLGAKGYDRLRDIEPKNLYELPNDHNFDDDNWLGLLGLLKDIL